MANVPLGTLDFPITLNESISFPDGYNCITIEGNGDEAGRERFPILTLQLKSRAADGRFYSDGKTWHDAILTIRDYTADDACMIQDMGEEKVNASSPWDISVGKSIYRLRGVWVWEGGTEPPFTKGPSLLPYLEIDPDTGKNFYGTTLRLNESYNGGDGLLYSEVIVEYDGGETASFTYGIDPQDQWWVIGSNRQNDDDSEDNDESVAASFNPESAQALVNGARGNLIAGIPSTATVTIKWMPTAGRTGYCYINAVYKGVEVQAAAWIDQGSLDDASITLELTATPSTVNPRSVTDPKAVHDSLLEGWITNSGGSLAGVVPSMFVYDGPGSVSNVSGLKTKRITEEVWSSDSKTVSVAHNIKSVVSIREGHTTETDGDGNGNPLPQAVANVNWSDPPHTAGGGGGYEIDGTTIKLTGGNEFRYNNTPLTIEYIADGYVTGNYNVGNGEVGEIATCFLVISGSKHNASCTINIEDFEDSSGVSASADPGTDMALQDSTDPEAVKEITLEAVATESDGKPYDGYITFMILDHDVAHSEIKIGLVGQTRDQASNMDQINVATFHEDKTEVVELSTPTTVSVEYPIWFQGIEVYDPENPEEHNPAPWQNYVWVRKEGVSEPYTIKKIVGNEITFEPPILGHGIQVEVEYKAGGIARAKFWSGFYPEEILLNIYKAVDASVGSSLTVTVGDPTGPGADWEMELEAYLYNKHDRDDDNFDMWAPDTAFLDSNEPVSECNGPSSWYLLVTRLRDKNTGDLVTGAAVTWKIVTPPAGPTTCRFASSPAIHYPTEEMADKLPPGTLDLNNTGEGIILTECRDFKVYDNNIDHNLKVEVWWTDPVTQQPQLAIDASLTLKAKSEEDDGGDFGGKVTYYDRKMKTAHVYVDAQGNAKAYGSGEIGGFEFAQTLPPDAVISGGVIGTNMTPGSVEFTYDPLSVPSDGTPTGSILSATWINGAERDEEDDVKEKHFTGRIPWPYKINDKKYTFSILDYAAFANTQSAGAGQKLFVAGAQVQFNGQTYTADAYGRVSVDIGGLTPGSRVPVVVTAPNYMANRDTGSGGGGDIPSADAYTVNDEIEVPSYPDTTYHLLPFNAILEFWNRWKTPTV